MARCFPLLSRIAAVTAMTLAAASLAPAQVDVELNFVSGSAQSLSQPNTNFTLRLLANSEGALSLPLVGYDLRLEYDPRQVEIIGVNPVQDVTPDYLPAPTLQPGVGTPAPLAGNRAYRHLYSFYFPGAPAPITPVPAGYSLVDVSFRTSASPTGDVLIAVKPNDRPNADFDNPALIFQDNANLLRIVGNTAADYPGVVFGASSQIEGEGAADFDADTVADFLEAVTRIPSLGQTNGALRDSDGDGVGDALELNFSGTSNFAFDQDQDIDPNNPDTDGDGYPDGVEAFLLSSDPLDPSSPAGLEDNDGDGLPSSIDPNDGSNDSNANGYADAYEAVLTFFTQGADLGDVNNDGSVTDQDVALLGQVVAGQTALTDASVANSSAMDLTGDGKITAADAVAARRLASGSIVVPFRAN